MHGNEETRLRVTLLGTLEVCRGDAVVAVPGARLHGLVARLALAGGQPVEPGVLVDALWPQELPTDPANALQSLVSARRCRSRTTPPSNRPRHRRRRRRRAGRSPAPAEASDQNGEGQDRADQRLPGQDRALDVADRRGAPRRFTVIADVDVDVDLQDIRHLAGDVEW